MLRLYRKQLLALAGFGLTLFSLVHLLGNCLYLFGEEAFNIYTKKLTEQWFILLAEIGLALFFIIHIFLGFYQSYEGYLQKGSSKTKNLKSTFSSRTMPLSGFILFIFMIFHLQHFRFASIETVFYNNIAHKNLYLTMTLFFQNPVHVLLYILAMFFIGLHLNHGVFSLTQSFGFLTKKRRPLFQKISLVYALIISVGFSFIALYSYFKGSL